MLVARECFQQRGGFRVYASRDFSDRQMDDALFPLTVEDIGLPAFVPDFSVGHAQG